MKIAFTILCILSLSRVLAGNPETSVISLSDSVISEATPGNYMPNDTTTQAKENTVTELFAIGKKALRGNPDYVHSKYPPFKGHWSGFNYGFVNFTNTDYSMYPPGTGEFMELDWSHSFVMQFNICKYSINLVPRNNFGLVCGVGLEYQRLRFENKYSSITLKNSHIIPVDLYQTPEIEQVKRSSFKVLYLTIPLLMEIQLPASQKNRFYVSGGVMGGVRIHTKTKLVYNDSQGDKHKNKGKGNFNMVPFKADVIARVGYRGVNVWGSYTLTDMFKSGKGPELHAYSIGLGVTF